MRLQYQLRQISGLSILVAIVGCGFFHDPNGPGSYQAVMKAQQSSEDALKGIGATLEKKQYPLGSAWVVDLTGKDVNSKTFEALKKIGPIAELKLKDTKVTDEDMKQLGQTELSGLLVDLDLGNTAVSDVGLKELKVSKFLMKLNLAGTKITDAGVADWQKERSANSNVAQNFKKVKISR